MRLANYEFAETLDKKEWLNSMKMKVGLNYFGGKSVIGKYIFNNIFNLSVEMKKQGRKPDIFIDAFTGGGKMGLSVPYGWYDTIVMNDLNYGIYSYYKCCQSDDYIALIYMIEKIGKLMSRDFFHVAAYLRSFGLNVDKWGDGTEFVTEDEVQEPLVAAALTYWVTAGSFNGQTDPDSLTYNLTRIIKKDDKEFDDKKMEQEEIAKVIKRAYKNIPKIHEQLNKQHYIIENLDYRELIKKYNGKKYSDLQGVEYEPEEQFIGKNILWYFDPPYHPVCLHGGKDAPYADAFTEKLSNEMTDILHGDREGEFGKLEYFIKSDYDPKEALQRAEAAVKLGDDCKESQLSWYQKLLEREKNNKEISTLFAKLEIYPFCKVCVGGFDKGAVLGKDKETRKSIGQEYIWCRGFFKGYEEIEGEPAKE